MNMVFSDIGLTTDVTLISVGNMSASTKDIYTLFDSLAQAGVDVDMKKSASTPCVAAT